MKKGKKLDYFLITLIVILAAISIGLFSFAIIKSIKDTKDNQVNVLMKRSKFMGINKDFDVTKLQFLSYSQTIDKWIYIDFKYDGQEGYLAGVRQEYFMKGACNYLIEDISLGKNGVTYQFDKRNGEYIGQPKLEKCLSDLVSTIPTVVKQNLRDGHTKDVNKDSWSK